MAILSKTVRLFLRHDVPAYYQQPIYQLSPDTRIGRGSKRDCHQHPNDPALCIKVSRKPHKPDAQQPSIVEWYCATTLDRRGVPFEYRARCHGWIETNRGPGLVVDRVRNADGQPSLTLFEFARQTQVANAQLDRLFAELKTWVIEHAIPVTDLNSGNLLVREHPERPRLVLVDGIGGQKVKLKFVLYRRCRWFARLLSRYRWSRLVWIAYNELQQDIAPGTSDRARASERGPATPRWLRVVLHKVWPPVR